MHSLVRTVFGRLKEINPEVEENKLRAPQGEGSSLEVKMNVEPPQNSHDDSLAPSASGEQHISNEQVPSPDPTRRFLFNALIYFNVS